MKNSNSNIERLYDLISKKLDDSILPEENKELNELVDFSDENKQIYNQTIKLWNSSEYAIKVDTIEAWKNVSSKIQNESKVFKIQNRFWYNIAAILLLGLSIFSIYKYNENKIITLSSGETPLNSIILSDKSIVDLNKNSTISYSKKFEENTRDVNLEGEAFFDVAKDKNKPFMIHTKTANIQVLGTSFSIKEKENMLEVLVKTGVVKVESNIDSSVNVTLNKGETVLFNSDKMQMQKGTLDQNKLFWKTKTLFFSNAKLDEVLTVLKETYMMDFTINSDSIHECKLTATFNDLKIEEIVEIISSTLVLEVENKNQNFQFSGKGCK